MNTNAFIQIRKSLERGKSNIKKSSVLRELSLSKYSKILQIAVLSFKIRILNPDPAFIRFI